MPGGEAFADVLQQKLQELHGDGAAPTSQTTGRPAPPLPFLFGPPRFHAGATPYRASVGPVWGGPQVHLRAPDCAEGKRDTVEKPNPGTADPRIPSVQSVSASAPRSARAQRMLTVPQQQALEKFVWLGAGLGPDFTWDELRSAFRMLAFRYHPDRHPHLTDSERARLARVFADLSDCHRQLAVAVTAVRH